MYGQGLYKWKVYILVYVLQSFWEKDFIKVHIIYFVEVPNEEEEEDCKDEDDDDDDDSSKDESTRVQQQVHPVQSHSVLYSMRLILNPTFKIIKCLLIFFV